MSVTVTRTKILIPRRRPDLLTRSRLISLLDDLLDYPFTLISAPAGYGKTSLMIDLAHQVDYPVCWFSIDPLDLDPNRFLAHFIHAIQVQFPEFGHTTLSVLDNQANPLQDPAQLISNLINEIYQTISEHFVLFLDDFHYLNTNQELCAFISSFGQAMDDNTHLVMASRTLFDFPDLPLLIGRRMVKGIGFGELAFQANEIRSYYKDILDRDISDEELENLFDQTEGWITGLVFSAYTDIVNLPGYNNADKVTGADLFQYLAEQVLDKQPKQIQEFLLRSSLLDEFNPVYCDQIFGQPDSDDWSDMISNLQKKNLFVQQVEDENSWFRYHTLFRDFLRSRLHEEDPEDEKDILSRLLVIYRKSNSWEKAFEITRQIGSPVLMAEVIEQASSVLIHQGRIKLLSSWLELLPEEGFEAYPILFILRGISHTSLGNPEQGLAYINSIINKPAIANDPYLSTRALLCRITTFRILGQYSKAISDIQNILEMGIPDSEDRLFAETEREAGLAYLNLGNFHNSKMHFRRSLSEYIKLYDIYNQALVHQDFGLLLMDYGFYHEAGNHFNVALETWTNSKNISQQANILNNIGNLLCLVGDYKKSKDILESAMVCSEASSNLRMQAFIHASQGDLARTISEYDFSLAKYQKAIEISEQIQEGYLLSYLALNQAIILRYIDRTEKAHDHLQIAHTFIVQGSSQNELGLWHLEMGYHLLALKDYSISYGSFLQAEEIFARAVKPIELAKTQIGLVLVCHEMPEICPTHQHLRDWVKNLKTLETLQPLMPELHFQGKRLEDALKNAPPDPILDALLDELYTYRDDLPLLQQELFPDLNLNPDLEEILEIFALGQNHVLRKGKKISSSEWIHQKTVRELFFYLLTLPRGATKEQIGLVFWPDSSPSKLTCQFKNVIYRLRRSVGKNTILYNPDSRTYHFNRDQAYSYDVEDFLALIQNAENEIQIPMRIENLVEAINFYSHPYSPQLDGTWAEPIRQSLSRSYERSLLTIAEYMLEEKQYQACLEYCRKVLNIEPCQEKAYQISLCANAKSKNRTDLIRTYKECQNNLMEYLNISPSTDTVTLYRNLLN